MSDLARKLATSPPSKERVQRGPRASCAVYGAGDMEDWEAIDAFRHQPGESWATTQKRWDGFLGLDYPAVPNDKFRYHWRRRCFCWPDDLRQA